jgi:hypothetical protein
VLFASWQVGPFPTSADQSEAAVVVCVECYGLREGWPLIQSTEVPELRECPSAPYIVVQAELPGPPAEVCDFHRSLWFAPCSELKDLV